MGIRTSSHSTSRDQQSAPNKHTSQTNGVAQNMRPRYSDGGTASRRANISNTSSSPQDLYQSSTTTQKRVPKTAGQLYHTTGHKPTNNGYGNSSSTANGNVRHGYQLKHVTPPSLSQHSCAPPARRKSTRSSGEDRVDAGNSQQTSGNMGRRSRSHSQKENENIVVNGTRNNRSRSVSPGRRRSSRQYYQLKPSASSADLRNFMRSYEKARKNSASSSQRPGEMTSFVIGRPPTYHQLGDLGVFKSISQVNDHLYICGAMALSEEKVRALKINCVVNATLEWPSLKIPGLETVRVQVDDVPTASLSPYFDRVADKIHDVASKGGKVLVHCMAGVSRSSTLCIAYLMKYKGLSLSQALSLMRSRRSIIRPNDGFWRQLVQYEKQLKKNKVSSNGSAPSLHRDSDGTLHRDSKGTLRKVSSTTRREQPAQVLVRLPSYIDNNKSVSHSVNHTVSPSTRVTTPAVRREFSTRTLTRKPSPSLNSLTASVTHSSKPVSNGRSYPSMQREIALGASRNWTTTYGNDYNRYQSKM